MTKGERKLLKDIGTALRLAQDNLAKVKLDKEDSLSPLFRDNVRCELAHSLKLLKILEVE